MGKIPGVIWRPIPENATQAKIRPTQWILHTFVDAPGPTNMAGYFERPDIKLESHTVLGWDKHQQLIDTDRSADANYKANRRPDGTGAVSTETEDDGKPVENPWNSYQVTELIRTGVELHKLHGIPARLPRTHDDPGMGYHSLFPGVWSNVKGKTCPGATRIRQFKEVILPGIQRLILPAPTKKDTVRKIVFYAAPLGHNHAYLVTEDGLGKYLDEKGLALANYLGVPAVNTPATAYDETWRSTVLLFDGPFRNVP